MKASKTINTNGGLSFTTNEKGLTIKVANRKEFFDCFDFKITYPKDCFGKRHREYTHDYVHICDFLEYCGLLRSDWHDLTGTVALFSGDIIAVGADYSQCSDEYTDDNVQYEAVYANLNYCIVDYLEELANKGEVFFALVKQDKD